MYSSHIFSLYDYRDAPTGLISENGMRRVDYYALRLAIRALQGCHPTYQAVSKNGNLLAIATKDAIHETSLLIANTSMVSTYRINVDLSLLIKSGNGKIWQFGRQHHDSITQQIGLANGHVAVNVPAQGGWSRFLHEMFGGY